MNYATLFDLEQYIFFLRPFLYFQIINPQILQKGSYNLCYILHNFNFINKFKVWHSKYVIFELSYKSIKFRTFWLRENKK